MFLPVEVQPSFYVDSCVPTTAISKLGQQKVFFLQKPYDDDKQSRMQQEAPWNLGEVMWKKSTMFLSFRPFKWSWKSQGIVGNK